MRSDRIVYHNNGRQDDRVPTLDEYSINSNLLTGSLAQDSLVDLDDELRRVFRIHQLSRSHFWLQ